MARKQRAVGLGDVVENVIKSTGLNKLAPDDCGCKERKEKLNQLLSFGKRIINCPTAEHIDFLNTVNGSINFKQRKELAAIYLYVYGSPIDENSTCGDCWNSWIKQIKQAI